ncbi:MAG TPA: hypothetical protein VJ895_02920, partial [Candidatus Nanoarchaeia archaeon]|nr:hypothetical protein [Candidatus Nanoarchaeia archaeon]
DDSKDKKIMNNAKELFDDIEFGDLFDTVLLQTEGSYNGCGLTKRMAIQYVLDNTKIDYIFNSDDNSRIDSEVTIPNILRTLKTVDKVGYCGTIGNYTIYYRDFDEYSARFFTNMGTFYGLRRDMLEDIGNFDPKLEGREDVELGVRAWKAGYWVVAVWAPIKHKTYHGKDDIFEKNGELWTRCTKYVAEKHKGYVIATSNGQIRRTKKLSYPEVEIGFDENMDFYVKELEDEDE